MIPPILNLVMKYFPEHKNILKTLYRQNESFRSLCADFRDCVQAMEYWCKSPLENKNAPALCEEYKALCEDLKREITNWLLEQSKGA